MFLLLLEPSCICNAIASTTPLQALLPSSSPPFSPLTSIETSSQVRPCLTVKLQIRVAKPHRERHRKRCSLVDILVCEHKTLWCILRSRSVSIICSARKHNIEYNLPEHPHFQAQRPRTCPQHSGYGSPTQSFLPHCLLPYKTAQHDPQKVL
jgi:hypothetical protein